VAGADHRQFEGEMEMTELDETEGGYLIDRPDYVAAMVQLAAALARLGVTLLHDLNVAIAVHHPKLHDKLQEMLAA
jgi:hypothetical protein